MGANAFVAVGPAMTVSPLGACPPLIEAPVTVTDPPPPGAVTAPTPEGHVVVMLGVPATDTFAGKVSVKLMPDCAGLPAPLANVKVSVEVPPWLIVVGAKALLSEACTTVSVWLVTPLVSTPPTATLTAPFTYALAAALLTSTDTVQVEAPAAALTPPPPIAKVPVPAVAVTAGAPPQVFVTFGAAATTRPAGRVSVNVRPARAGAPAG